MRYLNETILFWYMAMCTYIVITNPEAHNEFILIHAAILGLYKWMQEREHVKANPTIRVEPI